MPHRLGGRARLLPPRRRSADGAAPDARARRLVALISVQIRAAQPYDRDAIAALYVQLKRHHARLVPDAARYQVSDERWAGMALDALDDPAQKFYVAERDGSLVGFARVYYEEKSFGIACEVETLVVDDANRGRGIGDSLMKHVEEVARSAGARAVRVNVLHVNDGGLRFYERHGYRPVAMRLGKDL